MTIEEASKLITGYTYDLNGVYYHFEDNNKLAIKKGENWTYGTYSFSIIDDDIEVILVDNQGALINKFKVSDLGL